MTWDASSDLASTLVAVAPSPTPASSLSLTVTAGAGALFPVAPFDVLIHDQAVWPTKTTAEFARVLSVVGDVVTFSARALHGSSARTILVGDRISGVFTAEQLQAIQAAIDANTAAIVTNTTALAAKVASVAAADGSIVIGGTATNPTIRSTVSGGLTSFQGRSTAAAVLTKADVTGTGLAAADVGAALDSAAVHNTGAETVAGVKTFSSSPIVPDPTTAQQVASRAFVLANAGGGPNAVSRTLSTAGSVSGATPLDMTKDQTRQFVLSGNTVISASAVAANGGRLTLYADQPPSGGLYTLGISDGTTTFPVTDPGWTAGQRMTVLVDWFSPTSFSANVLGVATAPVIPTVPGAPTAVSGTPGNTTASIAFTPPASNGGSAITGYTATLSPGGATFSGSSSPISATGLTNGTPYTATVHATNAIGNSVESSSSGSFTPAAATVPGAPTIGTATGGNTTADVPWTAPGSNGGSAITGYVVTPYIGATAQTTTTVGNVLTAHITGLTNGTAYTFKVAAINAIGTGAQSGASNSVTPAATSAKTTAILADSPTYFWKLLDPSGTTAADSAGSNPATYTGGFTLAQAGLGDGEAAVLLDGSTGWLPSSVAHAGPTTFSLECWIKTTSVAGGCLIAFADRINLAAVNAIQDRFLYMDNAGRINFGGQPNGGMPRSPLAYNDGAWHHVVGVLSPGAGTILYVDGAAVVTSGALSGVGSYTGYWHIGAVYLGANAVVPTSNFFGGAVEKAVVYEGAALSAGRVLAHFNA